MSLLLWTACLPSPPVQAEPAKQRRAAEFQAEETRYLSTEALLDSLRSDVDTLQLLGWPHQLDTPNLAWPGGRMRYPSPPWGGWPSYAVCELAPQTWSPSSFDTFYYTEVPFASQREVLYERGFGMCTVLGEAPGGPPRVRPCPKPTASSPWTVRQLLLAECSDGEPTVFALSDILEGGGRWL